MSRNTKHCPLTDITALIENQINAGNQLTKQKTDVKPRKRKMQNRSPCQRPSFDYSPKEVDTCDHAEMMREFAEIKDFFKNLEFAPPRPTQEQMDEYMLNRTMNIKQETRETMVQKALSTVHPNAIVM